MMNIGARITRGSAQTPPAEVAALNRTRYSWLMGAAIQHYMAT
jgi:hypothetical protein